MKKPILFIIAVTVLYFHAIGQNNENYIKKVKTYAVRWNSKYVIPRTINNIRENYVFYFETEELDDLNKMFVDYDDCIEKLSSCKILEHSDSIPKKLVNTLVELYFSKEKKIQIFFDNNGCYYFQNKWHEKNDGLYYILFKFFSNEIVPQETLDDARKNKRDDLWHFEK